MKSDVTNLNSASLANFASGSTLMLIKSPPHERYILLSALVENCGPSMQTMHLSMCSSDPDPSSAFLTRLSRNCMSLLLNGSPNCACATTLRS